MKYRIIPPPAILQQHVEYLWILEYESVKESGLLFNTFVDNSSGLIFQHNQGESAFLKNDGERLLRCFVYGQTTKPSATRANGPFILTGALFKPTGLKMLMGIDAHLMTDNMISIADFKGGDSLEKNLLAATCSNLRIEVLIQFLMHRLDGILKEDMLVKHALGIIHKNPELVRIKSITDTFKISDRQFERRFKQSVGVSPIFYTRVMRFCKALDFMKSDQYLRLGDIAYALNYTDHSHFIKDIKEFSGKRPKDLSQAINDFVVNLSKPIGIE